MATLFNTKISATYPGLIKTIDNAAISATLKQLSDGSGNLSGLFVNTGGDFKVTAILEWGSLKDTGTGVTITQFVTAANGIANFNNDTTIPTSAAVKTYVDAVVTASDLDFKGDSGTGEVDLDSQLLEIAGTTNEITTVALNQKLTIGLPNNVTISGTYTGATFLGDLNGTINTATTAITQTAGNNSTKVATTAYVDSLDAASDLDFSGDSGTGDVTLNTQVLAITGTTNQIETVASNQGLSLSFPSALIIPSSTTATTQSAGDNSTKLATTAYVDTLDAASDLDITDGSTVGDVNLNTQSLSILGTANQITSTVLNQAVTLSLPSPIHRDLQGNADTATAWETARSLSVTGEATGTLLNVNGTQPVSGAVTLDNNSVTGKVLTGLPTPAAATVLATDSILDGFGKLQSQINGIANGLQFQGAWNATSNSPVLVSGGNEAASGTTTSTTTNKLVDSSANFTSTVTVGDKVINQVDRQTALVTGVDSNTILSLASDIMLTNEAYTIDNSPFITQGHYYVVNVGGTHPLNGINSWSVGDWVIAGSTNVWEKLDHTDVEGTGTPGNIAKWLTTGTIADSIMAETGAIINVSGSVATTAALSSAGNFSVNTNKLTANATTGNVAFVGNLAINTNKFTVNATSGNTLAAGTMTSPTFLGDLNGTINTSTTAVTQSANNNSTKVATTAYVDTSAGLYLPLAGGTLTGALTGTSATFAGNVGIGVTADASVRNFIKGSDDSTNNYQILTRNSSDANILAVRNDGNVAIGTTPITSPNGADTSLSIFSGQDCSIILKDSVETWEIYQNDDLQFSFGTTPTTVMTMQRTTGSVGIGTTSPASEANLSLGANSTTEGGHLVLFKGTSQTQATHLDNASNYFRIMNGADASSGGVQFSINHANAAATFAGNITSTATSFVQSFKVTDGSTFFDIDHSGNESWAFKCESIGGSNDAITIGTAGGTSAFDENGQITSTQKLDVATAGGRFTGKSNRGNLGSMNIEQVTTGADGGEIYFTTSPSGSTNSIKRLVIDSTGNIYNNSALFSTFYGLDSGNTSAQTGTNNAAYGYKALEALTSGAYNTSIGNASSQSMTTGNENTAVGYQSLGNNTTQSKLTALGYRAGYFWTAGDENTFIGYKAGFGTAAASTGGENTLIGSFAGAGSAGITGSGNTSIGRFTLNSLTGGSFNTALGHQSGINISTGESNTLVGKNSGVDIGTGSRNTLLGRSAGTKITSAADNIAIGFDALNNQLTNGQTVAIGVNALYTFTGSRLVAIGNNAAKNLVSDVDSVFIGQQAGEGRTTGIDNTFVGAYANFSAGTGCCNTGFGKATGYSLTTGVQNTFVGRQAGYSVTTQPNNTIVGHNAGINTTGAGNTIMGSGAGAKAGMTGTSHTIIGETAGDEITTGTNCIAIGYAAGSGSSPRQMTTNSNEIVIGSNAIVGAYVRVAWTVGSDKRDKINFDTVPYGLDFIDKLKPTSYDLRKERDSDEVIGKRKYGFIAQEILELEGKNPVIIDNSDENKLCYQESNLIPVLVKAIQELTAKVERLEQECKCK